MPYDGKAGSRAHGDELQLSKKLLQRSVVRRIGQIGATGRSQAPWVVELDPTTACNLACPDCISRELLNQGGFDNQRLRDLARELVDAGVRAVILIGGGEPLAHPESPWVITHLAESGVQVGVTTNGTLIDRHLDCLADHASWVRVSVDAGTAETFHRFRPSPKGVSAFDQVIGNMAQLAGCKRGKLGYSFLMLTEFSPEGEVVFSNVAEIAAAAALAREIGCDYFEVKPSFDLGHFLIGQPKALMAEARAQIAGLADLEDETFRVLMPTTLQHVLNGEPLMQPKGYSRCAVAELRTVVTPSGVYVCPYFRGHPGKKLGDVTRESFSEMWHGARRAEAMDRTDPSKDCRFHCIRHQSNLLMAQILSGAVQDAHPDFDFFI